MHSTRIILLGVLGFGCSDYDFISKDEDPGRETGELEELTPQLEVTPDMLSQIACTSEEASLTLSNVGTGSLEIFEMVIDGEGWGFGESLSFPFSLEPQESRDLVFIGTQGDGVLRILSDDPSTPEKQVALESLPDSPPSTQIVDPLHDSVVDVGVDLLLEAQVSDDVDSPEALSLSWVSSQDGLLHTASPDSTGSLQWTWPSLNRSEGPHQLELVATDSCQNDAAVDISICQQGGYTVDQLDISTWNFEGNATWDSSNSWLELTGLNESVVGSAFQTSSTVPAGSVSIEFLFYIGDGTGADGLSLTALDTSRMTSFLGGNGCGMGYGGGNACTAGPALPGWTIEVDTYHNSETDPTPEDHVAFSFDGNLSNIAAWAVLPELEDTGWHTMKVEVAEPHVLVQIDGVTYIDQNLSGNFNFPAYVGFTAGTGALTNRHLIDSLEVTEPLCEE